jgi:hypothetical protein
VTKTLIYIRIVYWIGIVIDALEAVSGVVSQYRDLVLGVEPTRGFGIMTAWTIILIWADRKPIDRRIVLLLTLIPIGATSLKTWIMACSGISSFQEQWVGFVGGPVLFLLYTVAYVVAARVDREE